MQSKAPAEKDFYIDEQGYYVFTARFHLKRGFCCGNGCRHCPYDYENVPKNKQETVRAKNAPYRKEEG